MRLITLQLIIKAVKTVATALEQEYQHLLNKRVKQVDFKDNVNEKSE